MAGRLGGGVEVLADPPPGGELSSNAKLAQRAPLSEASCDADFLLQVVARDLDDYSRFVETVHRVLPGVTSVTSNLSLREVKLTGRLPVSVPASI